MPKATVSITCALICSFSLFFTASAHSEAINITEDNAWRFGQLDAAFPYGCYADPDRGRGNHLGLLKPKKIEVGGRLKIKAGKKIKKYLRRLKKKKKAKLLEYKELLTKSSDTKEIKKAKKKVKKFKQKIKAFKKAKNHCGIFEPGDGTNPFPEPEPLSVNNKQIEVVENQAVQFTIEVLNAKGPLEFTFTTDPTKGLISGEAPTLTYQPTPHVLGQDQLQFRVTDGVDISDGTIEFNIIEDGEEFAGDPYLLAPYRETLTAQEMRHVMNKLFGGDPVILAAGLEGGREAFVEAFINHGSYAPDTFNARTWSTGNYFTQDAKRFINRNYIRNNPLRAVLAFHLMDWFSVNHSEFNNQAPYSHFIPEHLYFYLENALNFEGTEEGEDGGLGQVGGVGGKGTFFQFAIQQLSDGAMLHYLDNRFNTASSLNENFGT